MTSSIFRALGAVAWALGAASLAAQTPTPLAKAAEAITPEAIVQHVGVIAADSMLGRDTPSPGLAKTAQYLADQFAQLGLRPGGDRKEKRDSTGNAITITATRRNGTTYEREAQDTSWFYRYPVPGKLKFDYAGSQISFTTKLQWHDAPVVNERGWSITRTAAAGFGTSAWLGVDTIPESGSRGDWVDRAPPTSVVVAGPHTPTSVQRANLQGKIVFYVPSAGADSATQGQIVSTLGASNYVLILRSEDSATFAARRNAAARQPAVVVDRFMEGTVDAPHWIVNVWPSAIDGFLTAAGVDVATARGAAAPVVRELRSTWASLQPQIDRSADTTTAVNVVGILEGSRGPVMRQGPFGAYEWKDYVVIAAHMDHLGVTHGRADSINNGADDNASGVAGLIELARAFSQPGGRPSRGIIFLGLSGSAKGFWGSTHWARDIEERAVIAGINLDMIGRPAGDSVRVQGLQDIEFPVRTDWVAARHPELRLTMVDAGSVSNAESDHYAFVRKALPTLYFSNGKHGEAQPADTPDKIDAKQEARILRLVFYVATELANAEQTPRWTSEGRRHRIEVLGE